MTNRRHHIATFYFVLLLVGLGTGRVIDTYGPAALKMVAEHTCELRHMAFNPCAELDTTQVEDLRGAWAPAECWDEPGPTTVCGDYHRASPDADNFRPADSYELASDDQADPVADCLVEAGWTGIAGDSEARIYAPREAIERCADQVAGR